MRKYQQINKVKGQLGSPQKPKSPSGATTGGMPPPPKKWSHFFAKTREARQVRLDSSLGRIQMERGQPSGKDAEMEIAYASSRIRPFSLASEPAGRS
jgi:hypothetical protein